MLKKKNKGTPSSLLLLFLETHTASKEEKHLREKSASFLMWLGERVALVLNN